MNRSRLQTPRTVEEQPLPAPGIPNMEPLLSTEAFSNLDIQFARLMERLHGREAPALRLASALVSRSTREGHTCLDLGRSDLLPKEAKPEADEATLPLSALEPDAFRNAFTGSAIVGEPGDFKPLILDAAGRLYLNRYFEYQRKLADILLARIREPAPPHSPEAVRERLDRLFPGSSAPAGPVAEPDWQKLAAFTALRKRLCVISGGPGTGKTTTVARILALLIETEGTPRHRIALAAPTGKAAARLQEAIQAEKPKLACPEAVRDAIPETASTLHRLLGSRPDSSSFRHNAENPLEADVVVIDEASMTDLALMSKCVQAVPPRARLIIMGDRHQLASVEAGAVLSDICGGDRPPAFSHPFAAEAEAACGFQLEAAPAAPGLGDAIVSLRRNYRFGSDSGIGLLSEAIRRGDADQTLSILKSRAFTDLEWRDIPDGRALQKTLPPVVAEGYTPYLLAPSPEEAFQAFSDFRILCALREGPFGVSTLNAATERTLAAHGLIRLTSRWYRGRPVMVTRNDYGLRLFNGDIGIVSPDPESADEDRAVFPGDQGFRSVHTLRLPDHETVYALTVHKSQGSEFGTVLLVLPDRDSPVLTRELLYTAVTRARRRLILWAREEAVRAAVSRPTLRASGLYDALWGQA